MIKQHTLHNVTLLTPNTSVEDVSLDWFKPSHWRASGSITGSSNGRNTAYFFKHQQHEYVLRHYYRGGFIRRLIRERYVYTGVENTRCAKELNLLQVLYTAKLSVPRPVAALVTKHAASYSADLITQRIPNAEDIYQRLCTKPIDQTLWVKIGHCLRAFHNAQLYHADLNIRNLLADIDNKIWLIDFDRCEIKPGERWKQNNLNRLLRSLQKEKANNPKLYWDSANWEALLAGYNTNSKTGII